MSLDLKRLFSNEELRGKRIMTIKGYLNLSFGLFFAAVMLLCAACGNPDTNNTDIDPKDHESSQKISYEAERRSYTFPNEYDQILTVELASPTDQPEKCITRIFTDEEGKTLINLIWKSENHEGYVGKIWELNKSYPIEFIRRLAQGYRVTYLSDSFLYLITYDKDGSLADGKVYRRSAYVLNAFNDVNVGDPATKVMEIDKEYLYSFVAQKERSSYWESWHCTSDGYLVHFTYDQTGDGEWYVRSVSVELL